MQQGREHVDWARITYARVGVLRGLADSRSERQIADESGVAYSTVRSHVTTLKNLTGCRDIGEFARWWSLSAPEWHRWCAVHAGLDAG